MKRRIAHITDLHLDEDFPEDHGVNTRDRFQAVLKDIKREQISEVICTGDIAETESLSYFFEQFASTPLSLTLGNHDSFLHVYKYYKTGAKPASQKLYRSVQEEDFKFIFLDSSADSIDSEQLSWLSSELISSTPIIIFIHHPIIGLKLKVDEIGRLQNRDKVLSLLETASVQITLFCGHYHMESSSIYKNIHQHITQAVCFQIEKNLDEIKIDTTTFGYRIIELEQGSISSKVQLLTSAD